MMSLSRFVAPVASRAAFFRQQVYNVRVDLFFPASGLGAVWFVVRHWGWLRRNGAAGWPLPPVD